MTVEIRKRRMTDAKDLADVLSNKAILNNLRDGLPYPYTERDAAEYIAAMLAADPDSTFAYAVTVDGKVVGSIGAFRQENIHSRTAELGYYYTIKRLTPEELPGALSLIWEVFCQFVAPGYSEEGVQEFRASLDDNERSRAMHFYGAYAGGELVGVLAMRRPQHIRYFFVKAAYNRRGIGKKLFETMRQDYAQQVFTVHSSCAVEGYRHLGFRETDAKQSVKGLRYTAMKFEG